MDIPNIKPNSNASKENAGKSRSLLNKPAKVVEKEQPKGVKKLAKAFLPEDISSIKDYMLYQALPTLGKNFLGSLWQQFGTAMFGNQQTKTNANSGNTRGSIFATPYNSYSRQAVPRQTESVYDYSDIIYDSYDDANIVLDGLYDILEKYHVVKVFDLFDLSGAIPKPTDNNYGWTDLKGAKIDGFTSIERGIEGFVINLPRPRAL